VQVFVDPPPPPPALRKQRQDFKEIIKTQANNQYAFSTGVPSAPMPVRVFFGFLCEWSSFFENNASI